MQANTLFLCPCEMHTGSVVPYEVRSAKEFRLVAVRFCDLNYVIRNLSAWESFWNLANSNHSPPNGLMLTSRSTSCQANAGWESS